MMTPIKRMLMQATRACDYRCKPCFADVRPKVLARMPDELTLDEVEKLMDTVIPMGLEVLNLTGGDPLLRWDFCVDVMKMLQPTPVRVSVFTNGPEFTYDHAVTMLELGASHVQIPLHGACDETHDDFTGLPGSFQKSQDALLVAKRAGLKSIVRATLTSRSCWEAEEWVDLCVKLGVAQMRLKPIFPPNKASFDLIRDYFPPEEGRKKALATFLTARRDRVLDVRFLPPNMEYYWFDLLPEETVEVCWCGIDRVYITDIGDIKTCGQSPLKLGNIRTHDIRTLWEDHPHLTKTRTLRLLESKPEECGDCELWHLCQGGCPAVTLQAVDSLDRAPYGCPHLPLRLEG